MKDRVQRYRTWFLFFESWAQVSWCVDVLSSISLSGDICQPRIEGTDRGFEVLPPSTSQTDNKKKLHFISRLRELEMRSMFLFNM